MDYMNDDDLEYRAKIVMLKGSDGAGIQDIQKTSTSGLTDTYAITFSGGRKQTFNVTNGKEITKVEKTGSSGLTDTYTITFNDGTTQNYTITNGAKGDKGDTGATGPQGPKGDTGLLIYNGAANNSIYRGKNLGTSVTAAQYTAISDGTFDDLYIGDYWTIGGVNYRIAAFDYYWNCGDNATPPHHAVIVPEKSLYNAVMNTTDTTTGGYVGSQMYTTNLAQAKTTIKAAFSGHVVNHRIYLVNAVTNGYSSDGAWYDSEVDLMNEQMVYGSSIFSPASTGSVVPANYRVEKNQLPLFAMNPAMLNIREPYWLRDAITASLFNFVSGNGSTALIGAAYPYIGVRPAFCIS